MDDMNAKDLIRRRLQEAEPQRPSSERPLRMSGRSVRVPYHPPGAEEEGMSGEDMPGEDVPRTMGRAPQGQFSPKETSQLKDVLILMLATLCQSSLDRDIGQALMTGQELNPGQLQHLLDEVRNLNVELPESHNGLLQKIFTKLSQS